MFLTRQLGSWHEEGGCGSVIGVGIYLRPVWARNEVEKLNEDCILKELVVTALIFTACKY